MFKAILFDVDGVLINSKYKYFSDRFSQEYGVPNEAIMEFFKNDYPACALGKADLKETVVKYFPKWNWKGTTEDFLNYWFLEDCEKNERLLKFVKELREKGIKCYLSTGQEKYRMKFIWEDLRFSDYFDGKFVSNEIGFSKKEKTFFERILNDLPDYNPENILLIDNDEKVLQIAGDAGISTEKFNGVEKLREFFEK